MLLLVVAGVVLLVPIPLPLWLRGVLFIAVVVGWIWTLAHDRR